MTRDLQIEYMSLDDLAGRRHPDNPKAHDLFGLEASFARFGFADPCAINEEDGRLVGGHGRVEGLLLERAKGGARPLGISAGPEGEWLVPVLRGLHLPPAEARAYLIASNQLTIAGGWDGLRLASLLGELRESSGGLAGLGFTVAELDALLHALRVDDAAPASDPDDLSAALPGPRLYVKPGQTWLLGPHRLRCGDATNGRDVDALVATDTVDLVVTDPPYNVSYGRHGGASRGRRRRIANDAMSSEEFVIFARAWAEQLFRVLRGAAYIFMSSREWPQVSLALAEAEGHWSDTLIWQKSEFTLGRADYQHQYEPIWYGWPTGVKRYWCGDRDQGDVWSFPKPRASELHPTMKPVALLERAIENSSQPGGIVLDLFAGSGSTLIAAERQGRHCLAMELDPYYAQITIERWKACSHQEPRLKEE